MTSFFNNFKIDKKPTLALNYDLSLTKELKSDIKKLEMFMRLVDVDKVSISITFYAQIFRTEVL